MRTVTRWGETEAKMLSGPAQDLALGRHKLVETFWHHVRRLTRQAVTGEVFIAAESLFRAEQFFWQTGAEAGSV